MTAHGEGVSCLQMLAPVAREEEERGPPYLPRVCPASKRMFTTILDDFQLKSCIFNWILINSGLTLLSYGTRFRINAHLEILEIEVCNILQNPGNIGKRIFLIQSYPGNIGNLIFPIFPYPGNIGNMIFLIFW